MATLKGWLGVIVTFGMGVSWNRWSLENALWGAAVTFRGTHLSGAAELAGDAWLEGVAEGNIKNIRVMVFSPALSVSLCFLGLCERPPQCVCPRDSPTLTETVK